MPLNMDRRRIYTFGAVAVFLVLMLGLFQAPAYMPKEVTRMKTSVSTWLKGTEPSLEDELYKDSPHFSSTTKPKPAVETEEEYAEEDPYEIKAPEIDSPYDIQEPKTEHFSQRPPADDMLHAMPIATDDSPDVMAPDAVGDALAAAHTSASLPVYEDFMNVLPPTEIIAAVLSVQSTASAEPTTHHRHLEEMTRPADFDASSFVTHTTPAPAFATELADVAIPTNFREAFDDDKWMVDTSVSSKR